MNTIFYMQEEIETFDNKQAYWAGFVNALVTAQAMGYLNVDIRDLKIEERLSEQDIEKLNNKSIAV